MSTNSINLNLKFWLAGVITGVVLIERWRRHGDRSLSMTEPLRGDVASSSATGKPKASKAIVAGAKADAKRLLEQVKSTPSTSGKVEASSASPATSG